MKLSNLFGKGKEKKEETIVDKLGTGFDRKNVFLISKSKTLSSWFEKNHEALEYFGLTKSGCDFLDTDSATFDIVILGKMANACYTALEQPLPFEMHNMSDAIVAEEVLDGAAISNMAKVYEENKEYLSPNAKEMYEIKQPEFEDDSLEKQETPGGRKR